MRKGVAIPYIIALILGIVVIGLIGYWFFLMGGKVGKTTTDIECGRKIFTYCDEWSRSVFSIKPVLTAWDTSCGDSPTIPYCKELLKIPCKKTGIACTYSTECCSNQCENALCK